MLTVSIALHFIVKTNLALIQRMNMLTITYINIKLYFNIYKNKSFK